MLNDDVDLEKGYSDLIKLIDFLQGVTFTKKQKEAEKKENSTGNIESVRINWNRLSQAFSFYSNELKNLRDEKNVRHSRRISYFALSISTFTIILQILLFVL